MVKQSAPQVQKVPHKVPHMGHFYPPQKKLHPSPQKVCHPDEFKVVDSHIAVLRSVHIWPVVDPQPARWWVATGQIGWEEEQKTSRPTAP